ncbi:TetR/AcrR family transcriptional regulator [Alcanivorax quisquiliarum]|uniref:TetR/AcrR family transcriptional regulator n=1 Tax=Alcanivorax quisquiliarum TaxID=2933565 RepID=A0ABT0E7F5_9GAMM|nr:TetR/AcrR family transcriptional regulator [Alcanivorax quisquiliarum]MCK0537746.1 TetR/AcrR family transcriptional regulator [Alcanivorax quisquiliarum]
MEDKANQDLDAIREVVSQVLDAYQGQDHNMQRSQARAEILIHSMGVFAQRGLHRTTVQHLLDAADISRRTFYKYFDNKLDVLENIYRIFVENMILRFREQVQQSATVKDIIRNTTDIYFDYHVSMGPVIRLMMEEARSTGSALAPHRENGQALAVEILGAEIERLIQRRFDPLVLRTLLWNLENYSLYLLREGADKVGDGELARCKRIMTGIAEAVILGEVDPEQLAPARPRA